MSAAIEFEKLAKTFGPVQALDGVSLQVQPGEIYGFLGPNGAGKSTAIRILLDLIRPTRGRALVMGHDAQRESMAVRRLIGYLPGDLALYRRMDVDSFLDFMAAFRPHRYDAALRADLMDRLLVPHGRKIDVLSKGQKQKVGLLQALMSRPPVLILDEPTEGLDPIMRRVVLAILREMAEQGTTVFLSSHILAEAEAVCRRVALLSRGQLLDVIDVTAARRMAPHQVRIEFVAPPPPVLFANIEGVQIREIKGTTISLTVDERALDQVIKMAATRTVHDIDIREPTLQDLVLPLYEQAGSPAHRDEGETVDVAPA
jgi:ABC-2 type transport system ATP-binding protein